MPRKQFRVRRLPSLHPVQQRLERVRVAGTEGRKLLLLRQSKNRHMRNLLAASLGKWCRCITPSPSGVATTQADDCKAMSVNVVIGLYLTLSPMILLTFYMLLKTFNKTKFVCNSNCHINYYVFCTKYITGNRLHSIVADT